MTEIQPAEYRADVVVLLLDGDIRVRVLIVEVQLAVDPRKRLSLPAYVTVSRAIHGCPAGLLVVAPDPLVAAWCAEPNDYQSDFAKKYVAEGKAGAVLTVLRARGIAVPEAARERILAQKDSARLERWLEKATVAPSIAEVLDDPS